MSHDNDGVFKIKAATVKHKYLAVATILMLAAAFSAVWLARTASAQEEAKTTVTRDSVLLTGPRTIAAGDFIHVYDAAPYHIMKGHIAMKVPCDDKNNTSLQVLIGLTPNLKKVDLSPIKELSTPGKECLYHVDVASHKDPSNEYITDIVVKNTGDKEVKLSDTSGIIVGVDEIMPNPQAGQPGGAGAGGSMGNMTS
ncbi:MAG: hypothetical protein ABI348_10495 [Nitrososphaera sp.]